MMFDTIIEARELMGSIKSDSNVCVFDCRFSLADTSAGKKLWQESHIPGAFYAHLDENLSSQIVPGVTGRHPLPNKDTFLDWLRGHGVNKDTQIVAYDSAGGAIAARLWWLCRWIGHESCAVLNGGFNEWNKIGQTDAKQVSIPNEGNIKAQTPLLKTLNTLDVIEHKNALLIDAREYPRYLGEQEPIDPVAGHIPGAVSYPFPENLDEQGKFKTVEALQSRFKTLSEQVNEKELIVYCGSGVTAIHNILAMKIAGFRPPTLYEDSWSGWILDADRKIVIGSSAD